MDSYGFDQVSMVHSFSSPSTVTCFFQSKDHQQEETKNTLVSVVILKTAHIMLITWTTNDDQVSLISIQCFEEGQGDGDIAMIWDSCAREVVYQKQLYLPTT